MTGETFGALAGFYDALYADKDYQAETRFLIEVFERWGVQAGAEVLDLGCGTGGHALPLARAGYRVTGVDRSAAMVRLAAEKSAPEGVAAEFLVGDVRDVRLGRLFDAMISMFAVVSYQLTEDDLRAMLQTVLAHLRPQGLFVFDAWHGSAVLADPPVKRAKTVVLPDGDVVTRVARPTMDPKTRTVTVDYELTRERDGMQVERTQESHTVRYLFVDEIEDLLGRAGLEVLAIGPFMDLSRAPTQADWNISVVARVR